MRQSSSSNSAIVHRATVRLYAQRPSTRLAAVQLGLLMTACSSPPSIPTQFDAIERMPIHTVLVYNQRIAYLDAGAGSPVILIHGFGGSMWQWEYQQHTLSQHFRVLTLD